MSKYKVGIVSLGCDKNRVDSEIMLAKVKGNYEITNNPKEADIIMVNTCGFIEKAKQESIDTILEMAEYKEKHNCKLLIATGCLTQRYGKEIKELMPEIDLMLGVNDYEKINEYICNFIEKKEDVADHFNYSDENINEGERILTTDKSIAYLRIAEGCDKFCTYCIIPKIRGKFRSRKIENVINEAKSLAEQGIKEVILIAQDTSRYGIDLYGEKKLHELIKEISKIDGIEWIRILYCYPEEIYDELIDEMIENPKVCKYLDMPIQHISNTVLKTMGRRTTKESIINTIQKLRSRDENFIIRTSLIVGFPGETEEAFEELKEFLQEYKLDKVGVFTYSQEEGTPAAKMEKQISEDIKIAREGELMTIQMEVAKELNSKKLEKTYDVIIEGFEEECYYGRSREQAPEIDGNILVYSEKELQIGFIYKVKIIDMFEYDLVGVVHNESSKQININ